MIVHPRNWATVGQPIHLEQLETTLDKILTEIDCDCLSFSGGVDSCLLLYYLLKQGRQVRTFTMTCDPDHPDVQYAREALYAFQLTFRVKIESHFRVTAGLTGDDLVHAFYSGLSQWTDRIITGDGVDEFMAGYYPHQVDPQESTYYSYLRELQAGHLAPLDKNSGNTKVYVPYIDPRFVHLMAQIPLSEKVGPDGRKMIMMALAAGKVPQDNIERRKYGFGTKG